MNKHICTLSVVFSTRINLHFLPVRSVNINSAEKKLKESYELLNVPQNSKQDAVRRAFFELAKKYHPDSGSPDANIEKFISIEKAFRILTKHNTGASSSEEVEQIVYDIKHTAPQHRQYLSYEGHGHGTPAQREKQWIQARAQKAAENVLEYRVAKSMASENTLMKKGQYGKKHDIKTKYGFDRLVEDLIQESMSKGEFENLSGKGKPLNNQNRNPYVDFTTHKLNEVLINNGFTPEWITMNKEIDQDIETLKQDLEKERRLLGPYPLNESDAYKWQKICDSNRDLVKSLNNKINTYNLIVPLINKQKFHVEFDKICDEILRHGLHSVYNVKEVRQKVDDNKDIDRNYDNDIITLIIKAFSELISFRKETKVKSNE